MPTWSELDAELVDMLGDAISSSAEERMRWFNRAQQHFAQWHTARMLDTDYAGDGVTQDFTLPSDYIQIYSVYSQDREMLLEPLDEIPGARWDTEAGSADTVRPQAYIIWPQGNLHVFHVPPTDSDGAGLRVKYWAYWPDVTDDDDVILPPLWAHEALLTYAVARSYIPAMSDATFLNEFKTRVDSGNPVQNPMIQAHKRLLAHYEWLLKDFSRQVREPYHKTGGRDLR
jgi:hypothetical protein